MLNLSLGEKEEQEPDNDLWLTIQMYIGIQIMYIETYGRLSKSPFREKLEDDQAKELSESQLKAIHNRLVSVF